MKAIVEIEFKDLPVEKVQTILVDILQALKTSEYLDDARFQIHTPNGVVTEKCLFQGTKIVA